MSKFIVANWKLHPVTAQEAETLFKSVLGGVKGVKNVDVAVCPPAIFLPLLNQIKAKKIVLGAQNLFWEEKGAYTGEISGPMLRQFGCRYAIVGHSERKQYFYETDETINLKLKAAFKAGLKAVLCAGESDRGASEKEVAQILETQIQNALAGIPKGRLADLTIAYEPVWAIGTGLTVTPDDALKAKLFIKKVLMNLYDRPSAERVRILYGGSVNSKNISDFVQILDGALVGGASVDATEFVKIVKIASLA